MFDCRFVKNIGKNVVDEFESNSKVIILAKRVQEQANLYRKQLVKCQKKLNTNKYIIF